MELTREQILQIYQIVEEECENVNRMSWEEQIGQLLIILRSEKE